jgi:hypothetical protein
MEDKQEKMILEHEPVPGYRTVFYIALAAGVIYLVIVFGRALF